MGIWVRALDAEPGETVRRTSRANHLQGDRSVGGRLQLTTQRVVFTPSRIDEATGGRDWAIQLQDLLDIAVVERGSAPGLVSKVRALIEFTTSRATGRFLVPSPQALVEDWKGEVAL